MSHCKVCYSEVLPRWCAGIDAVRVPEAYRDILWIGVYTANLGEVMSLRWERIDFVQRILRLDETKTGKVLELPITRQLAAITKAGGTKFWFHGLRNSFMTVADRGLLLPRSKTKRLVNHALGADVTEGYAADWTVEQLRDPVQ